MGKAKNKVIDGVHKGKSISTNLKNELTINESFTKTISLNSCTCKEYLLLTEDTTKSASSAMARGLLGTILIGAPGLLAGLSAKNIGIYNVIITYRDNTQDLIEIDETYYKILVSSIGLLNANNPAFNNANEKKTELFDTALFYSDVEYVKISASHYGTLFLNKNDISFISHDGTINEIIDLRKISSVTSLFNTLNIACGLKTYSFKTDKSKEWKSQIKNI